MFSKNHSTLVEINGSLLSFLSLNDGFSKNRKSLSLQVYTQEIEICPKPIEEESKAQQVPLELPK
jgi:hypothetical protein